MENSKDLKDKTIQELVGMGYTLQAAERMKKVCGITIESIKKFLNLKK